MQTPKFVHIGSLTLSVPAFIIAVTGIVLSIAVTLYVPKLFVASLVMLAVFFVAAYNANCAVVGHCNVWAWVLSISYVLMALGNVGHWAALAKPYRKFGKR